jgi:hypothetical protein
VGDPDPIHIYKVIPRDADDDGIFNDTPHAYASKDENPIKLSANQYVLRPTGLAGNTDTKTDNSKYEVVSLADLGWNDDNGKPLWDSNSTLNKMFNIKSNH